jgi:hypothetical protein
MILAPMLARRGSLANMPITALSDAFLILNVGPRLDAVRARDGLANGYLDLGPGGSASTITTTAGMRFRF